MSKNELTTPRTVPSSAMRGTELISSHQICPASPRMPTSSSWMATPVRSATVDGSVSGVRGCPSSQRKVQLVSALVLPEAASQVKPSMRWALRLARVDPPLGVHLDQALGHRLDHGAGARGEVVRCRPLQGGDQASGRDVGEQAEQLEVVLVEGGGLRGHRRDQADRRSVVHQRHDDRGPGADARAERGLGARVGLAVDAELALQGQQGSASQGAGARDPVADRRSGDADRGAGDHDVTLGLGGDRPLGREDAQDGVGQDAEDDVEVRSGAGDVALGLEQPHQPVPDGVIRAEGVLVGGPRPRRSAGRHGHVLPIGIRGGPLEPIG